MPQSLVNAFRKRLYTPRELLGGLVAGDRRSYETTLDFRVYRDFVRDGHAVKHNPIDRIVVSLHDNSIAQAVNRWLKGKSPVGVMGGHGLSRDEPAYADVVQIAKALTERGYTIVSGGGPGAMEAAHLGASLAKRSPREVDLTLKSLRPAALPKGIDKLVGANGTINHDVLEALYDWQIPAWKAAQAIRATAKSLALPTWYYGFEPPTPLASHIGKYFQNSIREDGLVTVGTQGLIFAKGSAGTLQEAFQDAAQNYYAKTPDEFCPMVFLGKDYWTKTLNAYGLLKALFSRKPEEFARHVLCTDSVAEVCKFIGGFGKKRWAPQAG